MTAVARASAAPTTDQVPTPIWVVEIPIVGHDSGFPSEAHFSGGACDCAPGRKVILPERKATLRRKPRGFVLIGRGRGIVCSMFRVRGRAAGITLNVMCCIDDCYYQRNLLIWPILPFHFGYLRKRCSKEGIYSGIHLMWKDDALIFALPGAL